jgi:hypothetical protein
MVSMKIFEDYMLIVLTAQYFSYAGNNGAIN